MSRNILITLLKSELIKGFSPIVVVAGKRGCGKTCATITLAETIWPRYDFNKHHCYSLIEYMKAVNDVEEGGCLAIEESGTSLDRMRWQSPTNRIFNEATQINRYKNFITFLVLPDVSLLATNHIKMVEYMIWSTRKGAISVYRNFRLPIDISNKMMRVYNLKRFTDLPLPSPANYEKYKARDMSEKNKIREKLMKEAIKLETPKEEKIYDEIPQMNFES